MGGVIQMVVWVLITLLGISMEEILEVCPNILPVILREEVVMVLVHLDYNMLNLRVVDLVVVIIHTLHQWLVA